MNIYFVCTGNTCRSPMAEAILASKKLENVEVRSGGIYAIDGSPMSKNAQLVLDEQQISHAHMATKVNEDDLSWADLILTMTTGHKDAIAHQYPHAIEKMFTLKEYTTNSLDRNVRDPFGGGFGMYMETYQELAQLIEKLQHLLKEEN